MKKTFSAITLMILSSMFLVSAAVSINNCQQLQNIENNLSLSYELAHTIDCSEFDYGDGKGFKPIRNFSGSLDGKGYNIIGPYIYRNAEDEVGLFGSTYGALIKDIDLVSVNIRGKNYVGALIGKAYDTTVIDSSSNGYGRVNGYGDYLGGLIGSIESSSVTNCYSSVTVTSTEDFAGGLIGSIESMSSVDRCYTLGNVKGDIEVGGLAGENNGEIIESKAYGDIDCDEKCGGLVGLNTETGEIFNTYAQGDVDCSDQECGGHTGTNEGVIEDSYSIGGITGSSDDVGGFVGYNGGTLYNDYWDTESSGTSLGVGGGTDTGVTGKITSEMQDFYTFFNTGWDYGTPIWGVTDPESYPCLGWQNNCKNAPLCEDNDGDGYGVCPQCGVISGCMYDGDDCNDNDASVKPGATEVCDGIDNNCDGNVDEVDNDGDSVNDCNDDECLNSVADNIILNPNHYAQNVDFGVFECGSNNDESIVYTMDETKGCTCTQIAEKLGIGNGQIKNGCSPGIMQKFTGIEQVDDRKEGIGRRPGATGAVVDFFDSLF